MDRRHLIAAVARGEVIAIPTDTVYGFAARPDLPGAVEAIFRLKGRPDSKPLPVLGSSLEQLRAVAVIDGPAERVAERFWPGGVTIVVPRAGGFDHDLGGDELTTVAVRVPAHPETQSLLAETGPLAVTSANRSGEPAMSDAQAVAKAFPDVPLLDGGPGGGEPSTVISLIDEPHVLRPGSSTPELLRFLGSEL